MDETIVAVFDTADHAQAAMADLLTAHVPENAIATHNGTDAGRGSSFWSNLFGGEPGHDTALYERSLTAGSTIVTVRTPQDRIAGVMEVLERHHPIDIDERASSYGLATAPATTTAAANAAEQTIQLSEEQLEVGKRLVNRGTTRIRRFTTERPVEEQVTLHEERVVVERRPVTDHRVGEASFTDRVVEMAETGEEAVVGKTSRVVEEVVVGKEATDRVETVRDTVRREDVEIEQVPGATTRPTPRI